MSSKIENTSSCSKLHVETSSVFFFVFPVFSNKARHVRPSVCPVKAIAHHHCFVLSPLPSGFAVVLLVIHYLQVGCSPPVTPALQQLFPGVFRASTNALIDNLTSDLPVQIRSYKSSNTQSLGELLLGFFQYYSTFNWDKTMSIRTGSIRATAMHNRIWRGPYIRLEDPSDGGNVTRSVYDGYEFTRIKNAFNSASSQLKRNPSLDTIF